MMDALDSMETEIFIEGTYAYIGNIPAMCEISFDFVVKIPRFKSMKNRNGFTFKLKSRRFLTKRRNK